MLTEQGLLLRELRKKGTIIPDKLESTSNTGYAYIENSWGLDIAFVTIRHRRSNDVTKEDISYYQDLKNGSKTENPLVFTYETGAFSAFDYWWINFITVNGDMYNCKDNFYCSVSSNDDGKVQINLDGSKKEMTVSFSVSGGCYVALNSVTPPCPCA